MMPSMLLLLLACSAAVHSPLDAVIDAPEAFVAAGQRPALARPEGIGDAPEREDSTEAAEALDDALVPNDWMFTTTEVIEVSLTMSWDDIRALDADPTTPRPADITIDGETREDVGVNIKGRLGSRRTFGGKPGLKIDMNEFVPGQTLRGITILNLNNMVQDGSKVHELTAYAVYNAVGSPAPRVGYVHVTVNGVDYGLYSNVEAYNEAFLRRHYDDPSGNLYDGDYSMPTWGSYTMIDFWPGLDHLFQQDAGEDVALADVYAVTAAVTASYGTDQFEETVDPLIDWDQFRHYWAADAWIGQYDGYVYNRNNYRVYFDPADGKARFSPWDPDWAFYSGTPITSPYGLLAAGCKADPACFAAELDALSDVCDIVDTLPLQEQIDAAAALINPYLATDPRVGSDMGTIQYYQAQTRDWVVSRCATMGSL